MSDLTEFAGLSLAELTAEIDAMHPTFNAARTLSTPITALDCPAALPSERAVVGTHFEDRA